MWYAEYWDDEAGEYVSEVFSEVWSCIDWCFENQVTYYVDDDGREYFV